MSTSTVSANPASRRRPVLSGEKKSAGRDDLVTPSSGGKDLSHSISTEEVLDRARAVMKKPPSPATGPVSVTYARRTRKAEVRPEKPNWVRIVSILAKNLLLLIVLMGLVQMIRKLVYNTSSEGFSVSSGNEFERRIADVEGLLKKTTKMLQVQVEVVDKKLENGLSGVKMDLNRRIEEKNAELGNELKRFDESIEGLKKALGELKAGEWMKKDDFDGFIEEFRKRKGVDGVVDLDGVREVAKDIVERELERFSADGLGRVDYAVATGGAVVVKHSEQYAVGRGIEWFDRMKKGVHDDAVKMLSPSFGEPGQCFPLKGSSGFVQIKLRTAIIPEAVTLEHVAKSVAFDRSSAPKDCRISGWLQTHDVDPAVDTGKMILLTEFTYDLEKSNAQTFDVLDTPIVVDTIRLDFTSNHGNPVHTCIYRLRVHGHEPESIPLLAEQY